LPFGTKLLKARRCSDLILASDIGTAVLTGGNSDCTIRMFQLACCQENNWRDCMKNQSRTDRVGFTLVELSIVLVVIGLLIGGILVAQSMISAARIQSFIRAIQQFDAAVSNFQTKFNQFPGDSNLFSGGNNDGQLQDARGCGNAFCGTGFNGGGEICNFWPDLQKGVSFMSNKQFSVSIPAGGFDINSSTPNTPKVTLDVDAGIFPVQKAGYPTQYYIGFTQGAGGGGGNLDGDYGAAGVAAKPSTLLAIDSKIDDGLAQTGSVVTEYNSGICYNGNTYLANNTGVVCGVYINVLSQAGQSR